MTADNLPPWIRCPKCGAEISTTHSATIVDIQGEENAAQVNGQSADKLPPTVDEKVRKTIEPLKTTQSPPIAAPPIARTPLPPTIAKPTSQAASPLSDEGNRLAAWLILGGMGIGTFAILLTGMLILWFNRQPPDRSNSDSTASADPIAPPQFPELGSPQLLKSGASVYTVDFSAVGSNAPGMQMQLRVYLPNTSAVRHSIACVLVAPAGTTLLHGASLDDADYHDETLPYVNAGMAVIHYSLDGEISEQERTSDTAFVTALQRAYKAFDSANGGVTNGRVALEFALQRIPQVDPKRIYCAGHSSAATISLLLAAKEPRIAKCIAYAPITDLRERLRDLIEDPNVQFTFPRLEEFIEANSPIVQASRVQCPLFVFHARDDSNEPFASTDKFVKAMESAGVDITFASTPFGDHYQSMIDKGIPQAIQWLQKSTP